MNKKVISVIVALSMLALAIVLMLVFLLGANKGKDLPIGESLTIEVEDISLGRGESRYNFYKVNDENAAVSFELNKEGIILIDKDKIEGLNAGEVVVTIYVEIDNQIVSKNFNVSVFEENLRVSIIHLDNCFYVQEDNTLIMEKEIAQFRVEVFDNLNQPINDLNYKIICENENVTIEKEFSSILISSVENCQLYLIFNDLNFTFLLNVTTAFK
ncbi:MAG: hypothetical protein HFI85_02005 [Clostridia bacterium]|jgi:hypothetical protein|nr:hypothetical protein [Clostridia bacterium]